MDEAASKDLMQAINQQIEKDTDELNDFFMGKYILGRLLGKGSYGFVREWKDGSGTAKCVKILDKEYASLISQNLDADLKTGSFFSAEIESKRFWTFTMEEMQAVNSLSSTQNLHLMQSYPETQTVNLPSHRTLHLIVMPQLSTIETLELSSDPAVQIAEILCQCCDGLHTLHVRPTGLGRGPVALIHSDLKPKNIFFRSCQDNYAQENIYIVGDYSSCLYLDRMSPNGTKLEYPEAMRAHNPYCAPGAIGTNSDIWSLGWILWYWMNGKQHPTHDDIVSRLNSDTTHRPKNWGYNPELWQVFLQMTEYDPALRYKTVIQVQTALRKALHVRAERIARDKENDGKILGTVITLLVSGVVQWTTAQMSSNNRDEEGKIHGKSSDKLSFLGGVFQGTWNHGSPTQGVFCCDGVKRRGNWLMKHNYQIPFGSFGQITFSGLIALGQKEILYQGVIRIQWDCGTIFEANLRNGNFTDALMTFRDGTHRKGTWVMGQNGSFSGLFCEEGNRWYGCGILQLPGDVVFMGEIQQGQPAAGKLQFPNRVIPDSNQLAYQRAWVFLQQMQDLEGCFEGDWSEDGFPTVGRYTFSTGASVSGSFSYANNNGYTGMTFYNKACGLGCHPLTDELICWSEYQDNTVYGNLLVTHPCGGFFIGCWKNDSFLEGKLVHPNGSSESGSKWKILSSYTRKDGILLDGVFCNVEQKFSGLGTCILSQQNKKYNGIFFRGCQNGGTESP